jgi:malonyl-CoA decarboxylase
MDVLRGTLSNLRQVWEGISESLRDSEKVPTLQPSLSDGDAALLRRQMEACVTGRGGEVMVRRRAAGIGQAYLTLNSEGRRRFLELLAREFAADRPKVEAAARTLLQAEDEKAFLRAELHLREELASPRIRLLRHFLALPQGMKFLVDLRGDLLHHAGSDAALKSLDGELRGLLATWFDIGFLELHHITWDSPAALLEKLIAYEAVHEIHSWSDLRNRLESDRRCYAFFHPAMPGEPLIFVEVALVNGISDSIQTLLDQSAPDLKPEQADTAIFYSISNAQKGLRGISFGNFLIKQVVDELRHEFPNLRTFSTLSPLPGFARWLDAALGSNSDDALEESAREAVIAAADLLQLPPVLEEILSAPNRLHQSEIAQLLRDPMERLCARYLHQTGKDGLLDPVERFHLGNGARIERLNWGGDLSPNGMRQSWGMMVNYLYKLDEIEKNRESFTAEGRIATSSAVRALLRSPTREDGPRGKLTRILRMTLIP